MRIRSWLLIAISLGACSDDDSGGPADGTVCETSKLTVGDSMATLMHDGVARSYLLHVPASYDGKQKVPLVIDMHGLLSNAAQQKQYSGWVAKSDAEGFVLVHPDGLDNSWNGGSLCCGTSQQNSVDDVGFIKALVASLSAPACVDAARVYATGISNGGAMSYRLACEAADVFAAVAPSSMGNGTVPCTPGRPISVIMHRATGDNLVPYNGGPGTSFYPGLPTPSFPSAATDLAQWKMLDGCSGEPTTTHGICQSYPACNAGVEVTQCTVQTPSDDLASFGGHIIFDFAAAAGAAQPDVAWEAFARQTLSAR